MDQMALFALAVGIGALLLIVVVSLRFRGRRRGVSGRDAEALIPLGDDWGGDGGGDA